LWFSWPVPDEILMRTLLFLLAALTLSAMAVAPAVQSPIKMPQASPAATTTQAIGAATVEIEYHRPAVKGRTIWGGLVPYEKVWRTGANEATRIRFSDPVTVMGVDVPAGTYALFAVPTAQTWTLVLNKKADQWGAFAYDKAEDVLRVEVSPSACAMQEYLRYTIEPKSDNSGVVTLSWEKLALEFMVEVDSDKLVLAQIEQAVATAKDTDARVFYIAAKYYLDHNLSSEKALGWIDQSIAIEDGFRARECKAKLLDREGKKAPAIEQLEKAIELAKGKASPAVLDGLNRLLAENKAK
jgi:hypothetical protein